jgi:hypothetical protein
MAYCGCIIADNTFYLSVYLDKPVTVKLDYMMTSLIIYLRAVLIYAIVTIPALVIPTMYFISIMYVLFYGWFAWVLFTIIYLIVIRSRVDYDTKMLLLGIAVVPSVLFAFQMLEVLHEEENIWHSGPFLLFPVGAVVAGWISLSYSKAQIRDTCLSNILEKTDEVTS